MRQAYPTRPRNERTGVEPPILLSNAGTASTTIGGIPAIRSPWPAAPAGWTGTQRRQGGGKMDNMPGNVPGGLAEGKAPEAAGFLLD